MIKVKTGGVSVCISCTHPIEAGEPRATDDVLITICHHCLVAAVESFGEPHDDRKMPRGNASLEGCE